MKKALRLEYVVVVLAFLGLLAMAAGQTIDTDCWWHLRTGQWIAENRAVPLVDHFSYTKADMPWQYPTTDWLGDLTFYLVYAAAGLGGLNLFVAGLALLGFLFVWKTMQGDVYLKSVVLLLAAMVAGVHWVARPLMFSFVLSAVYVWLLLRYERDEGDGLWWLPVMMLLWVNLHGGFFSGYLIWGVFFASNLLRDLVPFFRAEQKHWKNLLGNKTRRLLVVGLVMLLASMVNPSGPGLLLYPLMTVNMQASKDWILEWQSPDFHVFATQPLIWLGLLVFIAVGVSRKRISLPEFFFMAGFGYMSLVSSRNFPYFALTAPMVILNHLGTVFTQLREGRVAGEEKPRLESFKLVLNAVLVVLMSLIALVRMINAVLPSEIEKPFAGTYPVYAVEYLQQAELPGNLFSTYNWGGYLTWNLREYPVFIDGRADLYGDEHIELWINLVNAEDDWQAVFEKYDIHSVLIDPHWALNEVLEEQGWALMYVDEMARVYSDE